MKPFNLLFLSFFVLSAVSQNQASTCFFGTVGIDFRTNPPTVINDIGMQSLESPASICDESGNILFYSNGGKSPGSPGIEGGVWNAEMVIMDSGILDDSSGCISSYQGAIIIPFPEGALTSNLYYLFTRDCVESSFLVPNFNAGLTYSVIDMDEDGGLGKVIEKNTPLVPFIDPGIIDPIHEPVTAILHGNNNDYWLFSYNNDSIYRLLISNTGISGYTTLKEGSGKLVFSPARDRLCAGNIIYDFDMNTGAISNPTVLAEHFSLTFSPDGQKLYGVDEDNLYQYDFSAPDLASSQTLIASVELQTDLFLAPNHEIYLFKSNVNELAGSIKCPNREGVSCNLNMTALSLGSGNTGVDLTNLMAHYLYSPEDCSFASTKEEYVNEWNLYPNPTAGNVQINAQDPIKSITLRNQLGQVVYTLMEIEQSYLNFQLPELSQGIYSISVNFGTNTSTKRLIIE